MSEVRAGFEPVSKVIESFDGAFVVAEHNAATGEFRVRCSGCPDMAKKRYLGYVGAVLAASYHADLDPFEHSVPLVDTQG